MNERRADRDIQQALTAWMDDAAPKQAPTRLLEDTFVQTMKTEQARVYPWSRLGIGLRPSVGGASNARIALVLVGALLVVALAAALTGGGLPVPSPSASSPAPTVSSAAPTKSVRSTLPPSTSITAEASIPVSGSLAMASDGVSLYVLAGGRIDRIDPVSNAVSGSVSVGLSSDLYNGLAVNTVGLWTTDSTTAIMTRVDATTLLVAARIPAGSAPKGVLADAAGVWVADVHGGAVLRFDLTSNLPVGSVTVGPTGNSGPNWLASGLDSIWVGVPNNGTVARIDPTADTIQATIQMPDGFTPCGGLAVATDAVWITACAGAGTMARIDPSTNTSATTVTLPGFAFNPTIIEGAVWASIDNGNARSGMLVRINAATNLIDRVLIPGAPFGGGGDIVVAAGSVWVVDGYNNVVLRLPLAAFAG